MTTRTQRFMTLFSLAALPAALACAGDPSDPIPRYTPEPADVQLTQMSVEPEAVVLHPGDNARLTAELIAPDGAPFESPTARVRWTSSNPGVVEVSGSGMLRALGPGKVVITAECRGHSARAAVTVFPAGDIDPPGERLREYRGGT